MRKQMRATQKIKHSTVKVPWVSAAVLAGLVLGCLLAEFVMTKDPTFLDLQNCSVAPNGEFLFGTDTLGRDLFSCIWYGGRVSLLIGFLATLISTVIAVVYGAVSGMAPKRLDAVLMRLTELILSVPSLLIILFVQAVFGKPNVVSISVAIGITSWCSIAKVVRTEVRQLRSSGYVVASQSMGGGFLHILRRHLLPNLVPTIMFMVVMNIRTAIGAEAVLSFMGMGLPLEVISLGSILSLAEKALMTKAWWMILIPGVFLIAFMMCLTNLGNWLRKSTSRKGSIL